MKPVLGGIDGFFNGGNNFALYRKRRTGDPRAGSRGMAAAIELGGDVIDIHFIALGAETDPGQFRFNFLEHAGDHDRGNGADVVDETFRVSAVRAGKRKIGLLQPEIRNFVLVGEAEMAVNVTQQPCA